MYVILVNKDNTMNATKKQRIVQKSKLVDDFYFLVEPEYNGHDMTSSTVLLEYLCPVSKKYRTEILTLDKDGYKGYLKYLLPVDTKITAEAGTLELQLSFIYIDSDANGRPVQRVRKTAPTLRVEIAPIAEWSDIIPDEALAPIDQRIIAQSAQIKALAELALAFDGEMVDNLEYNEADETLQLTANGKGIGDKVAIGHAIDKIVDEAFEEELEDGLPVVDFNSGSNPVVPDDNDDKDDEYDNVIEF